MNDQEERQSVEAARVQAKMTWAFYAALREQGFTAAHARDLTHTWVTAMLLGLCAQRPRGPA